MKCEHSQPARAAIAQLAARRSHNPKVVSSILTRRIFGMIPNCRIAGLQERHSERKSCLQRKKCDPGRTRTCNLWFRRPTPYPLGHRAAAAIPCNQIPRSAAQQLRAQTKYHVRCLAWGDRKSGGKYANFPLRRDLFLFFYLQLGATKQIPTSNNKRREARRPGASRHFLLKCPGPAGAAPTNSNRVSRLKHPKPSEDNNKRETRTRATQGTATYVTEPLVGGRAAHSQ